MRPNSRLLRSLALAAALTGTPALAMPERFDPATIQADAVAIYDQGMTAIHGGRSFEPGRVFGLVGLDMRIEFRSEAGFPLFRIGIVAEEIPAAAVAAWPRTAIVQTSSGRILMAELPSERDPAGFWTDWTYCQECFDVRGLQKARRLEDLSPLDEILMMIDGRFDPAIVLGTASLRFVPQDLALVRGADAVERARSTGSVLAGSRISLLPADEKPETYHAELKAFLGEPTAAELLVSTCGEFGLPSGLAGHPTQMMALIEKAYLAWEACADRVMDGYDRNARKARIDNFVLREASLAHTARIPPEQRPALVSAGAELDEARRIGLASHEAFHRSKAYLSSLARDAGEMEIESTESADVVVGPGEFGLMGEVESGLPGR